MELVFVTTSNTDRLNELAVHELIAHVVDKITNEGREALAANAAKATVGRWPRPTPGAMVDHVRSEPSLDTGAEISSEFGITPVEEARARPYESMFECDPADYPIFKDQGTGLFGEITSPTGGHMRFEAPGGTVFSRAVRGQEGSHFMDATWEEVTRVILPAAVDLFGAELEGLAA